MAQMGPDDVLELIKQLEPIRDKSIDNKAALQTLYSGAVTEKDARITTFSKLINVLNSVQLALTYMSKHLLDPNWWKWISRSDISKQDIQLYVNEFSNFSKLGYVQFIFSTTESSLRILLRSLDQSACNNGTDSFKSIYECLFRSKLASMPADGIELLDLLRMVRNTIHNNGVYFHRSGNDANVTWDGNLYEFKHGEPIDFVNWEFLFCVTDAIRDMLYCVVTDANIQNLAHEIIDPFAN